MVKKLLFILSVSGGKKLLFLSFGTLILSVSETLSIGIIIPIMGLFVNQEKIHSSQSIKWFYKLTGVADTVSLLTLLILAAIVLFVAKTVYALFMLYKQQQYLSSIDNSIKTSVLKAYLEKPYSFHLENNSSILFKNLNNEVNQFISGFLRPVTLIVSEVVITIGIFLLLIFIYPFVTISLLLFFGITLMSVNWLINKKIKSYAVARMVNSEKIYKYAMEALNAIKEIKIYNVSKFFINRFSSACEKYTDGYVKFSLVSMLPRYLMEVIVFCAVLCSLLISIFWGVKISEMIPVMTVMGVSALRVLPSISRIHTGFNHMHFSSNSLNVIYNILNGKTIEKDELPDNFSNISIEDSEAKSIRLDNITFGYESRPVPIFKDINITIPLFKTVAFAGVSGAGKSTLIDILMGLLIPSNGSLYYGETVINADNMLSYRKKVGYVPQQIYLIDDTLEANIAFGIPEARIDQMQLEHVLRIAQLSEFVKDMPYGLKTQVGERGIKLSGGQRQRIGIARALYHNPEILILDEATSALDGYTEFEITNAIKELHGKLTIILVAHRLTTIEHSDIIYVMENGQIVAQGNFSELLGCSPSFQKIANQINL